MKLLLAFLLALTLNAQTQTTVNGRKAYSGAVNAQTATYQALVSDFNAPCGTIPVASGTFTITLVASGSQPPAGQCLTIINYGSGVVTVARSGQNINGGTASLTLAAGSASAPTGVTVVSDGVNYEAQTFASGGGGGANITSGNYGSAPATCTHTSTASDLYIPTNSIFSLLTCTATNTWTPSISGISAPAPPVLANFTAVNAGSTTTDTTRGGVIFTNPTAESGFNYHSYVKTAPATPYHVIGCFMVVAGNGSNEMVGMEFRDSGSGKFTAFGEFSAIWQRWVGFNMTAPAGSSAATPVNVSGGPALYSPYQCVRIGDDGTTNRTFDIGTDSIGPWINMGSEARTAQYTANQVGFFINGGLQSLQMVHYSETN